MRYLALLLMGLISIPASALTKVNLYQTEVVLDSQQQDSDDDARLRGMEQVIVRATGNTASLDNDVIKKALHHNSQYLTQISSGQNNGQPTVKLGFSAPHIRSLLTQAQLPFWPEYRANLLVWLVEDNNYDRSVMWEHSDSPLLQSLQTEAQLRGLPITVPVGDFDDITGIQTSDLWGGFTGPIAQASMRYPTDGVLVIRAQGEDLRWTLYDQNAEQMASSIKEPVSGDASGEQAMQQLIDAVSQYYAQKNSVLVASQSSQYVLADFSGLKNAQDFFTLEQTLSALSSVAALDVLSIQGDKVEYKVHLLATPEDFEQEVMRTKQLEEVDMMGVPMSDIKTNYSNDNLDPSISSPMTGATMQDTLVDNPLSGDNVGSPSVDSSVQGENAITDDGLTAQGTAMVSQADTPPKNLYFRWLN